MVKYIIRKIQEEDIDVFAKYLFLVMVTKTNVEKVYIYAYILRL